MTDVVTAVAETLSEQERFGVVTGRRWTGLEALVDAGAIHVVAPGPSTRLAVAAGFAVGGHRAFAVLDQVAAGDPPAGPLLAFTTSVGCATAALDNGWTIVQPWTADDVRPLLAAAADRAALVLLSGEAEIADEDPPSARRSRLWLDGEIATLVGSGPVVPDMVGLAQRLQQRGVDIAAVEVALLDSPAQRPLVGGACVLVAGRDTATAFRGERWPDVPVSPVDFAGRSEADLIGAVLALVSAGR